MKANDEEITEIETDEWYMRRMNAGLAFLQDICYCLAWLIMEDDGVSASAARIGILLTDFTSYRLKRTRECFWTGAVERSRTSLPF
jgi:hypothetical protein